MNDAAAWGAWYAAYRAGRADRLTEPQVCELCSAGKPLGKKKLGADLELVKFFWGRGDGIGDLGRCIGMEEPNHSDPQKPSLQHQPDSDQPENGLSGSHNRDPGTPFSGVVAVVLALIFAGGVILWQNLPEDTQYGIIGESKPVAVIDAQSPAPGRFGQTDIMARMFIRGHSMMTQSGEEAQATIMQQFGLAFSNEDKVREIIMSGEFEGPDEALDRIRALQVELFTDVAREEFESLSESQADPQTDDADSDELDPRTSLIHAELRALESIYTKGPDSISKSKRDQLIARYGVLGQAALTHGMDADDPARKPIVTGFGWMMALLLGMGGLVLFSFLVGLVLLIIGCIQFGSGKLRMRCPKPAPGGSVFLETYALFVAGFGLMSIGLFVLSEKVNEALGILSLPLQWVLMLLTLWALVRGMRVRDWRKAIGLHCGEGFFKEVGCGIVAYLASIPIYFVGILITVVIMLVQGAMMAAKGEIPEEPSNPIFDLLSSGSPVMILLVFTLATVWAPITEELIFRGALFRHMSARLHWIVAAFFSAMLFAYMHSYGPLMVAPLVALGFMFAFMRQWRGSIVSCITAHFIHNATLFIFMITLIQLIKDPIICTRSLC